MSNGSSAAINWKRWTIIGLALLGLILVVLVFDVSIIKNDLTITKKVMGEMPSRQCYTDFTWSQEPGSLRVNFLATTDGPGCDLHSWYVGDGTKVINGGNPTHQYLSFGGYGVGLESCSIYDDGTKHSCRAISEVVTLVPTP